MRKIILIPVIFLLLNCTQKEAQKTKMLNNDTISKTEFVKFDLHNKELQENLNKAILDGDTLAYLRSYKTYTINGRDKEFLFYAITMAEKNNYRRAYYDIALILSLPPTDSLNKKYKYISKFGDYSFAKSYEMGDEAAREIAKYYKENNDKIPKSSSIYCRE